MRDGFEYFRISYEALLVLLTTSLSCAVIGSFLVLRKLSMVSDAISHTVLLGIVLAFFVVRDVSSPFLIAGAAIFGVLTVYAIEMLSGTGLVKNDDAVGIIFPMFFALAVILITKFAGNVHLDTDVVLMGEVILAPLNRIELFGISVPKALLQTLLLFAVNLTFLTVFFKELKISTFDREFAMVSGFSSAALFYALMTLSSMTAVLAFDAVGAVLVVSFLITPGASAYLVTKDLKKMIAVSCLYAVINSLLGYFLALLFNVSMSGMTAAVAGGSFFLTFLFCREGLVTRLALRIRSKEEFRLDLMTVHIGNHMGQDAEEAELGLSTIKDHLKWRQREVEKRAKRLMARGMIYTDENLNTYRLTKKGEMRYDELKSEYGM
ncbi:MAG: metal ABC transporter permease [Stomatobaculum sp.]